RLTIPDCGPVPAKPTANSCATASWTGMPSASSGVPATVRVLEAPPHPASTRTTRASAQLICRVRMNGTVVMKFGGTSVADAEKIKRAASRIVAKKDSGLNVVAVLSARGKDTDRLIREAQEISTHPD